jgi:type II secretory pathway component PulC
MWSGKKVFARNENSITEQLEQQRRRAMDKIKYLISIKFWRNVLGAGASKISFLSPVFAVAGFIMPLILGVSAGWLGSIFIEYTLAPKSAAMQLSMAAKTAIDQSASDADNGLGNFLKANPFSISALPVSASDALVVKDEPKVEVKNSFTTSTLAWTIPDIGAYVQGESNTKLKFIAIGENFESYKLTDVLYDRAVFQDEENNEITKFFCLAAKDSAPFIAQTIPIPQPEVIPQSNMIAATPDGQAGVITQEDLNKLMMNPFEEMRRFRMRPKFEGNEPVGIEIQWIQNDSVLGKLGVVKGDVLKSVNGIPMKNMGDITNAVNSLMNGTRFDVEVLRGNAPINLTYMVR